MSISVTQAIDPAIKRTTQMLFKPFDVKKWFVLGFCAWLATLGESGGPNMPNFGGVGGGPAPAPLPAPVPAPMPPTFPTTTPVGVSGGGVSVVTPSFPGGQTTTTTTDDSFWFVVTEAKRFFFNHAWWIVPLVCFLLILWVALMWVRARGKFMFLDGVARDQVAIVAPWKRFAVHANSYFRFELTLTLLMIAAFALIGGVAYLLAAGELQSQQISGSGVAAILLGVLGMLAVMISLGVAYAIANDFLVPLMYLRNATIGPAWGEFRGALLPGHVGTFVLYFLMKFVLGIAAGIAAMLLTCATCLIAALPYLNAVVLLPITVFFRSYSLYFLRQFGPDYNIMVERMPELMSAFPVVVPGQPYPGPYADPGVVPPTPPVPPPPPQWPPPPQV